MTIKITGSKLEIHNAAGIRTIWGDKAVAGMTEGETVEQFVDRNGGEKMAELVIIDRWHGAARVARAT